MSPIYPHWVPMPTTQPLKGTSGTQASPATAFCSLSVLARMGRPSLLVPPEHSSLSLAHGSLELSLRQTGDRNTGPCLGPYLWGAQVSLKPAQLREGPGAHARLIRDSLRRSEVTPCPPLSERWASRGTSPGRPPSLPCHLPRPRDQVSDQTVKGAG